MAHDKAAKDAGENRKGLRVDGRGQMELDDIDTPLGEAMDDFIKADSQVRRAIANKEEAADKVIEEMKNAGLRTIKYKGDKVQFQPGHKTPDKLKFVPAN